MPASEKISAQCLSRVPVILTYRNETCEIRADASDDGNRGLSGGQDPDQVCVRSREGAVAALQKQAARRIGAKPGQDFPLLPEASVRGADGDAVAGGAQDRGHIVDKGWISVGAVRGKKQDNLVFLRLRKEARQRGAASSAADNQPVCLHLAERPQNRLTADAVALLNLQLREECRSFL